MTTIGIAFVAAFIVAVIATRLVMKLALVLGIVDKPDGYRKVHKQDTPRMGGLAIYVAFAAPLVAMCIFSQLSTVSAEVLQRKREMIGLFAGATLALVAGMVDDAFGLRPRWKLVWQVLTASVVFAFGYSIKAISNPFGGPLNLGIFSFPVTVFWFVGCMNAVNLLDGLDGLAAGTCLFVSMTLFLVSLHFNNLLAMLVMASLSGAILGFLLFNFPPAKIFLGDSGSLLLGFLIAALSLVGASRKAEAAVALFIPIVALGLPILDTSVAIVRRWYKRLPIAMPDRQHIHHYLVSLGYSQQRAVLTLYAICLVLGGAALLITLARSEVVFFVIVALVATAFVSVRVFSGVRFADLLTKLSRDRAIGQRGFDARFGIARAIQSIRSAGSVEELWRACTRGLADLEFDSARLVLYGKGGLDEGAWSWAADEAPARAGNADTWSARLGLGEAEAWFGELTIEKHRNGAPPMAEAPELLDELRQAAAAQLETLARPTAGGESS